jgi:GcrA cell cycle regulator
MPPTEPAAPEIVLPTPDKRVTWTRQALERAVAMWKAGFSSREIGDALCVTRSAVMGKVHRMGLKRFGALDSPPRKARVKSNSAGFADQRHARRTAVAVQAPAAADIPVKFLGLSFAQLEAHHCKFPRGDEHFTFCGQPRLNGSPYCPHHHRLCFAKGPMR